MKRRLYPLLLLAVFLLGCLGHLLLKPKKEALFPYFVTFTSENVNNLLLYSLPNVGDALSFSGVSGEVLEIYHTPTTLHLRSEGVTKIQLLAGNVLQQHFFVGIAVDPLVQIAVGPHKGTGFSVNGQDLI